MKPYLSLLQEILEKGEKRQDRTGIGTLSVFGTQRKYDLRDGFPLVTTKKVNYRNIIIELLWFLKGDTNIKYLVDQGVNIWNEWPYETYKSSSEYKNESLSDFVKKIKTDAAFAQKWGDLGPVYGEQWIRWNAGNGIRINQIQNAIDLIKNDPYSRRIIVSGWNVGDIQSLIKGKKSAPPLCHTVFQFYVTQDRHLDLQLYQRSADCALGVPYNIASYAILLMMFAQECNLQPGIFVHTIGDAHIYLNHVDGIKKQLQREPKRLPRLEIKNKPFWEHDIDDFILHDYEHHPFIKFQIAV